MDDQSIHHLIIEKRKGVTDIWIVRFDALTLTGRAMAAEESETEHENSISTLITTMQCKCRTSWLHCRYAWSQVVSWILDTVVDHNTLLAWVSFTHRISSLFGKRKVGHYTQARGFLFLAAECVQKKGCISSLFEKLLHVSTLWYKARLAKKGSRPCCLPRQRGWD